MKRTLLCVIGVVALICARTAVGQPSQSNCITRVLFLGNSYTYVNNLPVLFSELAKSGHQCAVQTRMVAPGGKTLKDHWENRQSHDALASEHWDFVVLQDQSTLGTSYYFEGQPRVAGDEIFRPYAERWAAEVEKSGAKLLFYLTWARKRTPDDQAALNYAYAHAALQSHSGVAPVGPAWQHIRQQHPEIDLFYKDGSHPSPAGSYLAACVLYATIFHRSPQGLVGKISGAPIPIESGEVEADKTAVLVDLPMAQAAVLQAAAWQAVSEITTQLSAMAENPPRPPAPELPRGSSLSDADAGTWTGELLFYPGVGPVQMRLELHKSTTWQGHLTLSSTVKDFTPESLDLSDLRVGNGEFSFADPRSAGVNNWPIEFKGTVVGKELRGTATTNVQRDGHPLLVLGDWALHREQ
jgi:hypothetical protein